MNRNEKHEFRNLGRKDFKNIVMYFVYVHVFHQFNFLQQVDHEGTVCISNI